MCSRIKVSCRDCGWWPFLRAERSLARMGDRSIVTLGDITLLWNLFGCSLHSAGGHPNA
jgi:hypothetical protein